MKRILVPFDFSDVSTFALDFAVQIARKIPFTEVTLLNVLEHPSESRLKLMGANDIDPMENVYFNKLIQRVKEKLDDMVSKKEYSDVNLKHKIQMGNPYLTLSAEVASHEVELVVMGTHGADGFEELFVGSNTEKVVRTAKCPVISIKQPADVNQIQDIVFASDFTNIKAPFVAKVKELQKLMDAKLRIVKINTPANFTTTRQDIDQMKTFVKKFNIQNYTTEVYNYHNEEDGIILFAEDAIAQMIALGTTQRSGINHFISGSIAEDVVNHSTKPVWTMYFEE